MIKREACSDRAVCSNLISCRAEINFREVQWNLVYRAISIEVDMESNPVVYIWLLNEAMTKVKTLYLLLVVCAPCMDSCVIKLESCLSITGVLDYNWVVQCGVVPVFV